MTQSDIGIVERVEIAMPRLLLSATRVDMDVRVEADDAVKAALAIITEMVEALEALAEAARSSCDARQFQGLTEALADADALLAKVSGK